MGTSTRPQPLTPKKALSSRAELCDTIATRLADADAERVEPGGLRPGAPCQLGEGEVGPGRCRLVGLVDHGHPVRVDGDGAVEEVADGQRHLHGAPPGRFAALRLWRRSP